MYAGSVNAWNIGQFSSRAVYTVVLQDRGRVRVDLGSGRRRTRRRPRPHSDHRRVPDELAHVIVVIISVVAEPTAAAAAGA